jgi:hypothetical protein
MGTKTGLNGITFGDATVQNTAAVTGVSSAVAGSGISVSGATGAVTFTNSGVTSLVAGTGISVSGATGAVTVTATGGGVTSAVAGNGITVSGATGAVTFSQDFYTGSSGTNTSYPVGSYLFGNVSAGNSAALTVKLFNVYGYFQNTNASGGGISSVAGTWRARGASGMCAPDNGLMQRVA